MNNWSEKYDQWIWKSDVTDSSFFLVPTSDLVSFVGFSSLYAVSKEDSEAIQTTGSFAGFKGTVWSSTLALDFDTPESGVEAWERVCLSGLEAQLFKSGGKGYHILIERPHKPSHLLPQIDKEWVQTNYPKADASIYSSLHMFRLNGTIHNKTGKEKYLVLTNSGNPLILPDTTKEVVREELSSIPLRISNESVFLDQYIMNMTVPHEEGNRHRALLNVGMMLASKGTSLAFIQGWLQNMNLLFDAPKSEEELNGILEFIGNNQ